MFQEDPKLTFLPWNEAAYKMTQSSRKWRSAHKSWLSSAESLCYPRTLHCSLSVYLSPSSYSGSTSAFDDVGAAAFRRGLEHKGKALLSVIKTGNQRASSSLRPCDNTVKKALSVHPCGSSLDTKPRSALRPNTVAA